MFNMRVVEKHTLGSESIHCQAKASTSDSRAVSSLGSAVILEV